MNIKEYNVQDLFIQYLSRLSGNYPYIRLISDGTSTIISLGCEQYDDYVSDISHQDFIPFGKYPIAVDFQQLEVFLAESRSTLTALSSNEFLIENKATVAQCWHVKDDIPNIKISEELLKHLETHKRSILTLSKVRFLEYEEYRWHTTKIEDPIYLGTYNRTKAALILHCNPSYSGFGEIDAGNQVQGSSFVTSLYEIQHLDSNKFAVFVLKEGLYTITFEIINKAI